MNLGPEYPELLADLALQLRELLVKEAGLPGEQAEHLARIAVEHVRRHWGGQIVYVPTGTHHDARQQWREIWSKFTGNNVPQLATEYNKSELHIYYIIRQMRAITQRELQPELAGFPKTS